jgi:hypothetical protein
VQIAAVRARLRIALLTNPKECAKLAHNGICLAKHGRQVVPSAVLLVEPHPLLRAAVHQSIGGLAQVSDCVDFPSARTRLFAPPPDWLITNVRLDAFNGLHLVYLTSTSRVPIRSIVYGEVHDASLAREAQRAGAFYVSRDHLMVALPALLRGPLPPRDRRDPQIVDRRTTPRRGRRVTDLRSAATPIRL